jgi:putative membrane protein
MVPGYRAGRASHPLAWRHARCHRPGRRRARGPAARVHLGDGEHHLAQARDAFNQGFYNLFLAIEVFAGIVLMLVGLTSAGYALVLFGTGSMLAAAVVLSTRGETYRRASLTQGALPLIALVLLLLRM